MPLQAGSSQAVISANIGECLRSYRRTGKVGNITPRDSSHAKKICTAMAYDKARESNPNIPRK